MAITRDNFYLSGKPGNAIYYKQNDRNCVRSASEVVKMSEASKKSGAEFRITVVPAACVWDYY
ncbi:MAG: hypothetical protein ABI760_20150 [Ferruginibacter sp.]